MLKTELGPFLYQYNTAVNTLSFQPAFDRGALVRQIGITAPSATDVWIITVGGKEIMRARIRATGNQNILRDDDLGSTFHTDFFNFCRKFLSMDPAIPVPLGQTMSITSSGGATANIQIQFEEHDNADLPPSMLNHYQGMEWLIPVYTYLNASQTAAGVVNDDTQVSPAWLQNFFTGVLVTSAWKVQILGAFFEGVGVNTFSGAANHQSTTKTKRMFLDSRQMFGRATLGIPNIGAASAAGSANTAFGQTLGTFAPFEHVATPWDNVFNYPVVLQNGDTCNIQEELTGDLTGGASYEPALAMWVCRVSQLTPV